MSPTSKLFLVTREDLSFGQQAVQAAHAFREFIEQHRETEAVWYRSSNHLALLSVPNEKALENLMREA